MSAEVAGVLRLAAASALLRLARRHDSRMNSSCYGMLALVMQDDLEGVRSAFSTKVYKLMRHFQVTTRNTLFQVNLPASLHAIGLLLSSLLVGYNTFDI